jgi:hypothetical protein|tara:strand:+ start:528 stop:1136 length:609 start_codon:yes stop_codon:yes gene_type:complete
MSKKNLLNESTVRQFMKYANIGALAENFIGESYGEEEVVEEGDYMEEEEDLDPMSDELPVGDADIDIPVDGDVEVDADVDAPVDDVAGAPEVEMSEDEALALAQGLTDALTDLTGHDFTATGTEDAELPADDALVDDVVTDEVPPEEEEMLEGVDMIDEDEVVAETIRRVTKRIKSMKIAQKRDRMVETVTNRIMARIKKTK